MFFFLPRLVVSRTRGDEFHSLNATAIRCERSHWLNKDSCVDLPEPSMPSTTMSLPRWRFGTRRGIGEGAFHYNRGARTLAYRVDSCRRLFLCDVLTYVFTPTLVRRSRFGSTRSRLDL